MLLLSYCLLYPRGLRVTQNAYFSFLTHTKQQILVTFCDTSVKTGASFQTRRMSVTMTDGRTDWQTDLEVLDRSFVKATYLTMIFFCFFMFGWSTSSMHCAVSLKTFLWNGFIFIRKMVAIDMASKIISGYYKNCKQSAYTKSVIGEYFEPKTVIDSFSISFTDFVFDSSGSKYYIMHLSFFWPQVNSKWSSALLSWFYRWTPGKKKSFYNKSWTEIF